MKHPRSQINPKFLQSRDRAFWDRDLSFSEKERPFAVSALASSVPFDIRKSVTDNLTRGSDTITSSHFAIGSRSRSLGQPKTNDR